MELLDGNSSMVPTRADVGPQVLFLFRSLRITKLPSSSLIFQFDVTKLYMFVVRFLEKFYLPNIYFYPSA